MIHYSKTCALTLALCIAPAAVSQSIPYHLLPAEPDMLVVMAGPERAMQLLEGTNLATMLESQEAADIWARMQRSFLESDEAEIPAELRSLLTSMQDQLGGYSGTMSLGVRLLFDLPEDKVDMQMTIALSPDGETDLASLAEAARKAFEGDTPDAVITEAALADGSMVEVFASDERFFVLPRIVDEHLLFAVVSKESFIGEIGREPDATATDPTIEKQIADAVVWARVTERFWAKLGPVFDAIPDRPEFGMVFKSFTPMFDLIEAMQRVEFSVRAGGEFVIADYGFDSDASKDNIGDVLDPKSRIGLIDLAPRNLPSITTWSLDIPRIVAMIEKFAATAGSDLGEVETQIEQMAGFRLQEDLLDRLSGSILQVSAFDPDDEYLSTLAVALAVKDSAGLARTIDEALRKRGMHVGKKTEDYRGHEVSNMTFLGVFPIAWAMTDGEWILGFGSRPGELVRSILDEVEDRRAGNEPAAWSPKIDARMAGLQPDWRWISISDPSHDNEAWLAAVEVAMASDDDEDLPEGVAEAMLDGMRLLSRFDLHVSVSGVSFEPGQVRIRTVW